MLSFSISYPNLIELPYFADLTQRGDRGWKEAQRQGEDKMTLRKTVSFSNFLLGFLGILGNQEGAPRQDDPIILLWFP
jgi:hypothetical protein